MGYIQFQICRSWLTSEKKIGKGNYYINTSLMNLFMEFGKYEPAETSVSIEFFRVKEIPKS